MLFYILMDEEGHIKISPFPAMDKLYIRATAYLCPGLPLEMSSRYLSKKEKRFLSPSETINNMISCLKKDQGRISQSFQWRNIDADSPYYADCMKLDQEKTLFSDVLRRVRGRQIAEGEFSSLAGVLGINAVQTQILLHKAVIHQEGEWVPGLKRRNNSWMCERCGSASCEVWPSLFGETATCLSCKSIGPLSSLQVIFRAKEKMVTEKPRKLSEPEADWQFTKAQREAAQKLQEFAQSAETKETLVWAACGAGKTEITFPVIGKYLQSGKRVLFAAPRQNVVHDIQPRLQKYFSAYNVTLMSGAIKPDWEKRLLTVATTHQVLKFYKAFDLIIFDEMDAYPYSGNQVLAYGMSRALKESGKIIYLTATPSEAILQKVRRQQCTLIRLPARYHGYPLPVPEFVKFCLPNNVSKKEAMKAGSLPALGKLLRELTSSGQLFIFVPSVDLVGAWVNILSLWFKDKKISGSWSTDPDRKNHVDALTSGNCDIFVCTTILERGITVNRAQAAIFYADHELYDVRTLVQMAGRVGRTAENPNGRVLFIAAGQSKEMIGAINWIKEQNTLAAQGGFLND
jgi:competence protein ComFA